MRKCEFEIYELDGSAMIWKKYQGMFHQWAPQCEEFTEGPGNFTVALIELDDGTIKEAGPDKVKFLDKCPTV